MQKKQNWRESFLLRLILSKQNTKICKLSLLVLPFMIVYKHRKVRRGIWYLQIIIWKKRYFSFHKHRKVRREIWYLQIIIWKKRILAFSTNIDKLGGVIVLCMIYNEKKKFCLVYQHRNVGVSAIAEWQKKKNSIFYHYRMWGGGHLLLAKYCMEKKKFCHFLSA